MRKKIISCLILFTLLIPAIFSTCHASASAKVFSNSQSSQYYNCAVYAVSGLSTLGYSCTSDTGQILRSSMINWIRNTGDGYAMYVHTKGGDGYFNDYSGYSIGPTMISGVWDFVYIDSSKSAQSTSLSNAFGITSSSTNACFLGWSDSVTVSNSETFNYYFWLENIGNTSIYLAAINAAGHVPGSNAAPINLYGSTTYTGAAR